MSQNVNDQSAVIDLNNENQVSATDQPPPYIECYVDNKGNVKEKKIII